MYFEAKLKGKAYKINVNETKRTWEITLQREDSDAETHIIDKSDYQKMDDGISFLFQNSSYMVDAVGEGLEYRVYTRGSYRIIPLYNDEALLHESLKGGGGVGTDSSLVAGMPGKIVEILVKEGDEVDMNEPLLIMEAMKMENEMRAPRPVKIKEIVVEPGQSVETGAVLITYE